MESERPNPDDFQRDDQAGEFNVTVRFNGTVRLTVEAADEDEARAKAEAICDRADLDVASDDVDEATVDRVAAKPSMYLITRGGKAIRASWLEPGDLPREPSEGGF